MNSKILLLSVAVISVGLFAMPTTLSLFAGQHTFDKGADVKCEKCHQDIYGEIAGTGKYGVSTAHTALTACQGCHEIGNISQVPIGKNGTNQKYYGWFNRTNLSGAHAAVTMECAGCHYGVPANISRSNEAHAPFYNASLAESSTNGTNMLTGANEACVGCHTHININITWRRSVGYNMIVNESTTGMYNISFTANTSVNITRTANGSVRADE